LTRDTNTFTRETTKLTKEVINIERGKDFTEHSNAKKQVSGVVQHCFEEGYSQVEFIEELGLRKDGRRSEATDCIKQSPTPDRAMGQTTKPQGEYYYVSITKSTCISSR
jgi:hypothetical protein